MAKRVQQPRQPNRRHISRLEQERRQRRYLIIGAVVTFALVLALLAWGLVDNYVLKPARPVTTIGDEIIRTRDYQKLLQYRRFDSQMYLETLQQQRNQYAGVEDYAFLLDYIDQQISSVQQSYAMLPTTVLDQMIKDVIIRREAASRGITVSDDEVQLLLEQQFGYDRNAGDVAEAAAEVVATLQAEETAIAVPTVALSSEGGLSATAGVTATLPVTPTATPYPTEVPMTEDEFTETSTHFFDTIETEVDFTEADFLRLLESSLYQDKLEEALKAEMSTTAEQVHARHILVATEEEAQQVLDRLAAGEAFDALATELSLDTGSAAEGGELGWFARGQMVTEFEEAAFTLEPGTISEPVQTTYGFHIIEVLERDDNRELEGNALAAYQSGQLDAWYAERTTAEDVIRSWSWDMVPADPYRLG